MSLDQNSRCGVWGASCLTWSAGDTWNAKGIARGVKAREPWEILPKGQDQCRKENLKLNLQ